MKHYFFWAVVSILTLTSCSSNNVEKYRAGQEQLNLQDFFSGNLVAHGIVKNRGGDVFRHFKAEIVANWQKTGTGTLNEIFWFDDGEIQKRVWTLVPQKDGSYQASANDVEGTAILRVSGNSIKMKYRLIVPLDDDTITVSVDDKMYLVAPNTIVNESSLSKFGFHVGAVTLSITKL